MNLRELRRACVGQLTDSGIERAFYEADLILAHRLGVSKNNLIAKYEETLSPHDCAGIFSMIGERCAKKPLSYLLKEAEFYGRPFSVGPGVLIPRPEPELLVEAVLEAAPGARRFADWCTGSGCIGITLLLENLGLSGIGVDASLPALRYADENRRKYKLEERFALIQNKAPSELAATCGPFDFIVANPPYIPRGEIAGLMTDVRDYEPQEALDGGEEGIDLYRLFFASFPGMIVSGGFFACETGGGEQARKLTLLAPQCFVLHKEIYDYNGILRHLIWQKK